ncbi:unnamed protein product [Medioppia subpectinata]|uniref:lysine--tRNA ligase n=1 Tax=Medioppia subpectinata TaxID=1979941 RepID=A0A7R9PUN7_9ACAR|nr:unnamed protein product [Medioppia subpectinata]CAG2101416.1 unnamed protein product [Medioppia subpectinata]
MIVSSTLGSGILFMPASFNQLGYLTAWIVVAMIGLLNWYSIYSLSYAAESAKGDKEQTYSSVAEMFSKKLKLVVDLTFSISNLGTCFIFLRRAAKYSSILICQILPKSVDSEICRKVVLALLSIFSFRMLLLESLSSLSPLSYLSMFSALYYLGLMISLGFFGYKAAGKELYDKMILDLIIESPSENPFLHFSQNKESETVILKRHIDLIVNKDSMKRFLDRSVIISHIRNYFNEMDFIEVETPMMSVSAGGAAARPFVTHHNELKLDLFMRVAPELFLKKLVIGGMNRVFEIGRNFRNEGIDLTHNPEFTSIEFYMAYVDYRDMMDIVEDLLSKLVVKAKGSKKFTYEPLKRGGEEVKVDLDFSTPFQRLDILEEINSILRLQLTGENISKPENLELLIEAAEKNNLEISEPKTLNRVLDAFIGEYIEPRCINPTFVTGFPVAMSPLAKDDRNRKGITERFEMFLNGKEICNAYTELNIPDVQRERFLMQAADANAGDDEAMPADEDFCQALEFALPPTGGCGIGIDRLVMYLTNAANIRDVILFPTMKPENN